VVSEMVCGYGTPAIWTRRRTRSGLVGTASPGAHRKAPTVAARPRSWIPDNLCSRLLSNWANDGSPCTSWCGSISRTARRVFGLRLCWLARRGDKCRRSAHVLVAERPVLGLAAFASPVAFHCLFSFASFPELPPRAILLHRRVGRRTKSQNRNKDDHAEHGDDQHNAPRSQVGKRDDHEKAQHEAAQDHERAGEQAGPRNSFW